MKIAVYYFDKNNMVSTETVDSISMNEVYECIGKFFPLIKIPSVLEVTVTDDFKKDYHIIYEAKQRGSYVKNGIEIPSMFVTVKRDEFLKSFDNKLDFSHLKECYLTCVNFESNNYKFYHMTPTPAGIEVEYGRIGAEAGEMFGKRQVQTPYHPSLYWVRYYEKLSKGYIDNSKAYLTKAVKKEAKAETKKEHETTSKVNQAERDLYNVLFAYSKHYVQKHLVNDDISVGQVEEAKRIFTALCERKTVNGFNNQLLKLMQISPRRVIDVSSLMAKSESDFAKIIDREESLILSMEAIATGGEIIKTEGSFHNGVQVFIATDKQKEEVMNHLSSELRAKVDTIYRVIPTVQQKKFNKYLEENKISNVKQLWHGSKNENWLSIIENGLSLSAGVAHGRMFGTGLYFAPSSMKSWGYTSYKGTYWAKGTDNVAFMGLYAVAYGKPVDVSCSQSFTEAELKRRGCNCVHAHAGSALRNDEIIFYNENATLLNYIVKFK